MIDHDDKFGFITHTFFILKWTNSEKWSIFNAFQCFQKGSTLFQYSYSGNLTCYIMHLLCIHDRLFFSCSLWNESKYLWNHLFSAFLTALKYQWSLFLLMAFAHYPVLVNSWTAESLFCSLLYAQCLEQRPAQMLNKYLLNADFLNMFNSRMLIEPLLIIAQQKWEQSMYPAKGE